MNHISFYLNHISKSFLLFTAAFMIALLAFVSSGYASDVNETEAKTIKETITRKIEELSSIQKLAGEEYMWDGDVIVEPSGNFFAITLPYLKIKQMDGRLIDIGMLAVNTVPSGDGMWRVAVAIPTPIKITEPNNTETYEFSIEKQRMNGLWVIDAEQFLKLDGAYENIIVKDSANNVVMSAPKSRLIYDFDIVSDGLWSGDYSFSVDDAKIAVDEHMVSFQQIALLGTAEEFNIQSIKDFQEKMNETSESLNSPGGPVIQDDMITELANNFTDYLSNFGKSSTGAFKTTGFEVSTTDTDTNTATSLFTMEEFNMTFDMLDMNTNSSTVSFGTAFKQAVLNTSAIDNPMPASPDAIEAYLPENISFKIGLNNLPTQKLIQKFQTDVLNAAENAATNQSNQGMEFLQMLIDNNSRIFIEDTGISSALYGLDIKADMLPAPASPYQVKGTASATLSKLSTLMNKLQQEAQNTNEPMLSTYAQQALGMLTMVQMMGQQQPNGNDIDYIYNFEIKETGDMMLNGSDLSQIKAMMGGQ